MIKTKKRIVICAAILLTMGYATSCKHEAGVLDKCLGKNIAIDTLVVQDTLGSLSGTEIIIDSTMVRDDNPKPPFSVSFDMGKSWNKLPLDTQNLATSKAYTIMIKDKDSCVSNPYTINL